MELLLIIVMSGERNSRGVDGITQRVAVSEIAQLINGPGHSKGPLQAVDVFFFLFAMPILLCDAEKRPMWLLMRNA